MDGMAQPAQVTALSDELRAFTERAWQQLQDEQDAILASWPKASADARRKRLADLQATAARLTAQVDELALALATTGLHTAYTFGAAAGGSAQFTAADVDALGVLAQDLYDAVLKSTKGVNNSTKLLVRTLAREHVGDRLLGGKTATQAARDLRIELESKGIHAITYANGSRHGLAEYVGMLSRSQTALAYNGGTINAARRTGISFMEVFDGFGCFSGDSRVGAHGGLVAVARAWYVGPALTLRVGGDRLTVGPNHPVLTRRGWLPAHALREGDEVGHDPRRPQALGVVVDSDLVEVPPIEDVFQAAAAAFGAPLRRRCVGADLHGDGQFGQEEIQVVPTRRVLLHEADPAFAQQIRERALVRTDADLPGLPGCGHPAPFDFRVHASSRSHMSLRDLGELPGFVEKLPLVAGGAGFGAEPLRLALRLEDFAAPFAGTLDPLDPPGMALLGPASLAVDRHALGRAELAPSGLGGLATLGAVGRQRERREVPRSLAHVAGLAAQRGLVLPDLDATIAAVSWRTLDHIDPMSFEGWMYDCSASYGTLDAEGIIIKNCGWEGHDDSDKANGTVRSIEECAQVPFSHNNCTRAFGPRPDVVDDQGATDATRSQTAGQAADQRQVQIVRQARVEARARRLAQRRQKIDARSGV